MAMQVLKDGENIDASAPRTAVSIGVFDGVHLGHRVVLAQLGAMAQSDGLATAVVTFDRHPALVTRPQNAPKLLTTLEQKLELLEEAGIDYVYLVRFDEERAQTASLSSLSRCLSMACEPRPSWWAKIFTSVEVEKATSTFCATLARLWGLMWWGWGWSKPRRRPSRRCRPLRFVVSWRVATSGP